MDCVKDECSDPGGTLIPVSCLFDRSVIQPTLDVKSWNLDVAIFVNDTHSGIICLVLCGCSVIGWSVDDHSLPVTWPIVGIASAVVTGGFFSSAHFLEK